mgnify:FL=1
MRCEVDEMNIRDGYMMTDLGELPIDWETVSLEKISEHITKGSTPTTYGFNFMEEGINFIKIESINDFSGSIRFESLAKIEPECHFKFSRSQLKKNDILFAIAGAIGKCVIITDEILPANTNQALAIIRLVQNINTVYIYYQLKGPYTQMIVDQAKTVTAQANISLTQVSQLLIPLPSKSEQQKIADILSTVDEHISETEALIEKTKVLKQGMLQRLLTKGIGHTDFKDTEIGRIPVEWSVVKFSTLVLFQEGPGLRKWQYTTSGIPFLNIRCIQNNSIDRRSIQFISIEEYESKYKHFSLNSGDLVVSSSGTVGKKDIIKTRDLPLMLNTSIIRMKTLDEKRLSMSFLNYFVESDFYQKAVTQESVGSAQANYGPYHLNKIDIILPPIEEQHRIASILTAIDDQIDSYQTKLTTLTKLKSALMQQLLTGKIRVKI